MKLVENILRFEEHLRRARELVNKDLNDYFVYTALAMECFQAVNALIEVAEYVVVRKRLGIPSSYREIFEILHRQGWLSGEELQAAKSLVFIGNVIAHEYHRLRPEDLRNAVDGLAQVQGFIRRAAEREKDSAG